MAHKKEDIMQMYCCIHVVIGESSIRRSSPATQTFCQPQPSTSKHNIFAVMLEYGTIYHVKDITQNSIKKRNIKCLGISYIHNGNINKWIQNLYIHLNRQQTTGQS